MSTFMRYLRDPYNQVFRITANSDSVFRLSINGQIFYTVSQIAAYMSNINSYYFPSDSDQFYKYLSFLIANSGSQNRLSLTQSMNENPLHFFNSWCADVCYLIPQTSLRLLNNFYPGNCHPAVYPDHGSTYIDEVGLFDVMMREINYKGHYTYATIDEIIADKLIHLEPLRKWYNWTVNYTHDTSLIEKRSAIGATAIDNLVMRLPASSYITLPVKTANVPKTSEGSDITTRANVVFNATTGITGLVEMPFTLTRITGEGSVVVNNITYNLPDDEASLIAVLQAYEDYYNQFTIVTNTGGIEAEYLLTHRFQLFNKNTIDLNVISGAVTISRVTTETPMDITTVSVDKKTANSFTLDFINIISTNKSFRVPKGVLLQWDSRFVFFENRTANTYLPQLLYNYTANNHYNINCPTEVVDQCFAASLSPRQTTFASTLELTFTAVDGSDTYYTLDESAPTAAKTKYTAPFTISATTTVKWINIREGYADSHVNTRVITKTA